MSNLHHYFRLIQEEQRTEGQFDTHILSQEVDQFTFGDNEQNGMVPFTIVDDMELLYKMYSTNGEPRQDSIERELEEDLLPMPKNPGRTRKNFSNLSLIPI